MFFYFLYKNKKDLYKRQKDFGETKNPSLPFLTIFGICSEKRNRKGSEGSIPFYRMVTIVAPKPYSRKEASWLG